MKIIGGVKVLTYVNFFIPCFDFLNFRISQSDQPNFDHPQMSKML